MLTFQYYVMSEICFRIIGEGKKIWEGLVHGDGLMVVEALLWAYGGSTCYFIYYCTYSKFSTINNFKSLHLFTKGVNRYFFSPEDNREIQIQILFHVKKKKKKNKSPKGNKEN